MDKLTEIKKRFLKTTRGPWVVSNNCEDKCITTKDGNEVLGVSEWIRVEDEDFKFMACAWEDIKWVISELESKE